MKLFHSTTPQILLRFTSILLLNILFKLIKETFLFFFKKPQHNAHLIQAQHFLLVIISLSIAFTLAEVQIEKGIMVHCEEDWFQGWGMSSGAHS